MKRTIVIATIFLALISCTGRQVRLSLEDVESYIMERPDSALAVLEAVDRDDLTTERSRAHHALLYAMALDKNYVDVTDDSIARVAVDYYKDHEPMYNYARSLFYLGRCYFYNQEYDKAILEFSKAEKIAKDCDSLYLGMIKTAQADTYDKTYNSDEALKCIQEGLKIYQTLGLERLIRPAKYSLAIAYHNTDQYEEAIRIYDDIIDSSDEPDYYLAQSLTASALSMLETPSVNYDEVANRYRRAIYEFSAELSEQDSLAWAYTLYRTGQQSESKKIMDKYEHVESIHACFWKTKTAIFQNDYETAFNNYRLTQRGQKEVIERLLSESLASYQKDYFQSQLQIAEYEVHTRTMEMMSIVIISILLFVVIFLVIIRYINKQKAERARLFDYVEEIKHQLQEAERNDYSVLKRKYLSLYQARFETIKVLYEKYHQSEGRRDIETLMFKKVMDMIYEVKKNSLNRKKFEAMLDEDLDMIMSRIRQEMPKFSETDYSIFSYLIVGFDATTISLLLDMTVNNVYAHKRRIRVRIEERNPEHASQFLEILC